jgi:hypothetical protein
MILVKSKSKAPIKIPTPIEIPITREVSLIASLRDGQITFPSSLRTSLKKTTGLVAIDIRNFITEGGRYQGGL